MILLMALMVDLHSALFTDGEAEADTGKGVPHRYRPEQQWSQKMNPVVPIPRILRVNKGSIISSALGDLHCSVTLGHFCEPQET